MRLTDIIKEQTISSEEAKFNEVDVKNAITNEKPYIELKKVFDEDFWPKVERWLEDKLKSIRLTDSEKNIVGGELHAVLNKYLEKGTDRYDINAKSMSREIISVYKKWAEKNIKDPNLPKGRFK